jgi:ABC-2 type transport system ATP-binding protein
MNAIQIQDVTKTFGGHIAVKDLSLVVPQGCLYGLIGPNGSGKTTTLRMVMNLLFPDSGNIEVLGQEGSSAARDQVSYLPEERGLYKKMTVRRLLRYYGLLKGAEPSKLDSAIPRWLERLGLSEWADKKIEALSKGMSQKVQFISSVISEPQLLILDEPFSGLDPVNAEELKKTVLEIRAQGTTVVFSTHDIATAETLCDRIGMIFKGEKVLDGTLEEIQSGYGQDTVRVRTAGGVKTLEGLDGILSFKDHGNFQELRLKGDPQEFLKRLLGRTPVTLFEIKKPSLQEIFIRIAKPDGNNHEPQ